MRILLAIMTSQRHVDRANSVRQTWAKDVPPHVDYKFFVGREGKETWDTVRVDAPDDYQGLIEKSRELHRWGYRQEYDYIFKADDDTCIHVGYLLGSGFNIHDYFGHTHTWPGGLKSHPYGFCGGGEGYWLSRRACSYLIYAPAPETDTYAEDRWVGDVMGRNGMTMIDHPWYGNRVTRHGSLECAIRRVPYTPEWMFQAYAEMRRA